MLPLALAMDGEVVDAVSAAISPFDRTASFGDGLFETLRVVGPQPRHPALHLARLAASAARLQLPVPAADEIMAVTARVVASARLLDADGDLRIKWMFTRGIAGWAEPPFRADTGHWLVSASSAPPPPAGLRLALVDLPLPRRHQSTMKTMAYLDALTAKQLALAASADEAIRFDWQGLVAEGAAVNLFARHGSVLSTAPVAGIVPGVVRHIVVTNAPSEEVNEAVAEHTFALMISLSRRIPEADVFSKAKKYVGWSPTHFMGPILTGKTLGIIGAGRIGASTAGAAVNGLGRNLVNSA
ncbi:MAG: aminotransferase class IV [Kofleriaceae bacterium]|nr:aminotransferase class IV [Kofleriaceae bacterium]